MSASPKQMLVDAIKDETARTRRLLNAYPESASELRPHETCQSARELAHTFCVEAGISAAAVNGTLDVSKMGSMPPAPAKWGDVLTAFDAAYADLINALERTSDAQMADAVTFPTGPKQMGQVPRLALVQYMLNDQIHHRGQLSVYLRMSGAKVPSIYGPSKDEPWM
jgi:uncharacterized damage-inducible protein DinB